MFRRLWLWRIRDSSGIWELTRSPSAARWGMISWRAALWRAEAPSPSSWLRTCISDRTRIWRERWRRCLWPWNWSGITPRRRSLSCMSTPFILGTGTTTWHRPAGGTSARSRRRWAIMSVRFWQASPMRLPCTRLRKTRSWRLKGSLRYWSAWRCAGIFPRRRLRPWRRRWVSWLDWCSRVCIGLRMLGT